MSERTVPRAVDTGGGVAGCAGQATSARSARSSSLAAAALDLIGAEGTGETQPHRAGGADTRPDPR